MSESMRPIPVSRRPSAAEDRLDSWKEFAAYLGREVRTVQGWEKNEALPVHRHQHARQGSVYAFKSELDAWREARKGVAGVLDETAPAGEPVTARPRWPRIVGLAVIPILVIAAFLFWKNRQAKSSGATPSSVVVLPFVDMSPQKDQDYFSDGLTEEIIDALSRVPNLRVVARTSAFTFKGKANDIRQIGQQLNVDAVLEGSVRKSGDQLRITAQLNRVSDGTHLWSRTFDRQLRDVFAVQREISQSIADQLRAGQVPHREATANLEAYRFYQEGRYFFNQQLPPTSYYKAIERYQQAIERDPNFALAYSGLADAYAYLAGNFVVAPREAMPKAKQAAEKAVALDDNSGEVHTSLGIVKLDYEWDREGAQREFQRAMQLNPGSGWVHHWYAHSLEAQGRMDEAMKEMRASLALDPLSVAINWDIANELFLSNRYDETLSHLAKALELFPNHPILLYFQAEAYHAKGDAQSVHRVIESLKAIRAGTEHDSFSDTFIGVAAAWDGRRAEAEQTLANLERLRATEYVEAIEVVELCSALGDSKCLHRWLNRGYEERSALFVYVPLMKRFYGNDPEAQALIARLH
jgi:TolB-like protein/cytochrome c-type biogenesis protein CcmH/NrfG